MYSFSNIVKDKPFGILIHGGAGSNRNLSDEGGLREKLSNVMKTATSYAYDILKDNSVTNIRNTDENSNNIYSNTAALDAVESAVIAMEDSELFDAGINGSYLTIDGRIEMDAAIMNGKNLAAGAVGMIQNIRNPIHLARLVMEKTDHVMLVGEGALELAKIFNIETTEAQPTRENLLNYNKFLKDILEDNNEIIKDEYPKNHRYFKDIINNNNSDHQMGTVGAVAIDKQGNVASGVSTGGRAFKMHGRIGDSAIIGSGLYADNDVGASCITGIGEYIMRICLAKTACDFLKIECENREARKINSAWIASEKTVKYLTEKFGYDTGGIINVDRCGNFGAYTNTKLMPIALMSDATGKVEVGFDNQDFDIIFGR
jgi:L-asparaginase / beta-aspartyl-peptidase